MGFRIGENLLFNLRKAPGSRVKARKTMVSVTMATSEWIQFFKEAGIPPGPAVNYAVMFVDNRIQKSMLLDLNKEIMNELGVTVVGDIIAILKHAKVVHRQDMCKAATESVPCNPSPLQGELRRGASSAASRMIANSLNHDSPPHTPTRRSDNSTSKISVTVSNKMAAKSAKAAALAHREEESLVVPTKRRRVTAEMEGKYIIHMPKGTTPRTRKILEQQQAAKGLHRTSVFDRLGAESKAGNGRPAPAFIPSAFLEGTPALPRSSRRHKAWLSPAFSWFQALGNTAIFPGF